MMIWDLVVYISAAVVYISVIATIIGWIKYEMDTRKEKTVE